MNTIVLSVLGVLAVGVIITLLTSEGAFKARAKKVVSVVGVTLVASAVVAIVTAIVAFIFMSALSSELEDSFYTEDTPASSYEDTEEYFPEETGPSFGDNNEILPDADDSEGWQMFCDPASGISQSNRDNYCAE